MFRGLFKQSGTGAKAKAKKKLRDTELQFKDFKISYGINHFLPANLAQLFLIMVSIAKPEVGLLIFLSYLIENLSNDRIPLITSALQHYNDSLSSAEHSIDERLINQSHLVCQINPLAKIPGMLARVLISSELQQMTTMVTGISLIDIIDEKTDYYSRNKRTDALAQLNYHGNCYGLEMTWYAYILLKREDEFFNDLKDIAQINRSITHQELTERQKKLLNAIAKAQRHQRVSLSLDIPTPNGTGLVTVFLQKDERVEEYFLNGQNLERNLQQLIKHIFMRAQEQPGKLIALGLWDSECKGHAIGVVAYNKTQLGYFDSNRRQVSFKNAKEAINNLYYLLRFNYDHFFTGSNPGAIVITAFRGIGLNYQADVTHWRHMTFGNIKPYSSPFADMAISSDMLRHGYFRPFTATTGRKKANKTLLLLSQEDHHNPENKATSRGGPNK
jgi:hypothetical protein